MKYIVCFLAGAAGPLAFSPFHFGWLVFPSLAVLFSLVLKSQNSRQAFFLAYAYAFAFFGVGVNWLHISINLFGGVNIVGAYLATYALVAFISLYPALTAWMTKRFFGSSPGLKPAFILSSLWIITEWCRSWIFTGFPWLNIGYTQTDSLLASFAPVIGVYGLGFFVAMIAACLSFIVIGNLKEKVRSLVLISGIFLIAFLINDIEWTQPKDKEIKVALIQGGIPQELKWKEEQRQKTVQLYSGLSEQYLDQDLIIWPETAMPFFFDQARPLIDSIRQTAKESNTDFLIGFPYRETEGNKYYNSLVSIGENEDIYFKQHLVPFGEYLPFNAVLRPVLYFLKIPMSDFSKGEQEKPVLKVADEIMGISICYEDVFGEEVIRALPEATVLINVSNDAWFGDSIAPPQHLQMARMRAIETGRFMIRATNNGISAVIDNKGKILQQSPQFEAYAMSASIRPYEGITPYGRFGNWLVIVPLLLLIGLLKKFN